MLPSSPLAPFTPAILQHLPEPEPEPRSDQPVQPDQNPLSPLAPVAVGTQGKCCGDVDGGGGGGGGELTENVNTNGFGFVVPNLQKLSFYTDYTAAAFPDLAFLTIMPLYNTAVITFWHSQIATYGGGSLGVFDTNNIPLFFVDGNARTITIGGQRGESGSMLNIKNLPTSNAGLFSGDVWNNGGVLNIVP